MTAKRCRRIKGLYVRDSLPEASRSVERGSVVKSPKQPESWPEVLKAWRKRRGLTQREASEFFGVTIRSYNRWENGTSRPIFGVPKHAREILDN